MSGCVCSHLRLHVCHHVCLHAYLCKGVFVCLFSECLNVSLFVSCAIFVFPRCVWIAGRILVETSWRSVGVSNATKSRNMTHEAVTAFFETEITSCEREPHRSGNVRRARNSTTVVSQTSWRRYRMCAYHLEWPIAMWLLCSFGAGLWFVNRLWQRACASRAKQHYVLPAAQRCAVC